MANFWPVPEGVHVLPDGAWRVGGFPIAHAPSLRHLKERLVFEADGAFIRDGAQRLPVVVEGPPFEVVSLRLDRKTGEARALLDDGTAESLRDPALNEDSGRFECLCRAGNARAVFSRTAHPVLLDNLTEEQGAFFLSVGPRKIPVRT